MLDIMANVKSWSDEGEIFDYLKRILDGNAFDGKGLIYGMGHAVYTLSDPRAVLLKGKAASLAEAAGRMDEFKLYELVERMSPEVFLKVTGKTKEISANVDFYSGLVYSCLDIPEDLFCPIFAVSRIAGWCAHRVEELVSGGRIIRPAYKNLTKRQPYVPLVERRSLVAS
jgi:citrate synthase